MTILASRPVTSVSLTAARLSIAAVIANQVLLMALMFPRPELDPSWHTISGWAIGRHGWVMVLAFLISALSYGSLLVAIKSQVQVPGASLGSHCSCSAPLARSVWESSSPIQCP